MYTVPNNGTNNNNCVCVCVCPGVSCSRIIESLFLWDSVVRHGSGFMPFAGTSQSAACVCVCLAFCSGLPSHRTQSPNGHENVHRDQQRASSSVGAEGTLPCNPPGKHRWGNVAPSHGGPPGPGP